MTLLQSALAQVYTCELELNRYRDAYEHERELFCRRTACEGRPLACGRASLAGVLTSVLTGVQPTLTHLAWCRMQDAQACCVAAEHALARALDQAHDLERYQGVRRATGPSCGVSPHGAAALEAALERAQAAR